MARRKATQFVRASADSPVPHATQTHPEGDVNGSGKGVMIQGTIAPELNAYLRMFALATNKSKIEALEWMIRETQKRHPISIPQINL